MGGGEVRGAFKSLWAVLFSLVPWAAADAIKPEYFGFRVVDDATGRGIPLTEWRTVNDIRIVSDNAGWVSFQEPGLMDREVWFYLSLSPGYEGKKDGFGYTGVRLLTRPGTTAEVKLKRTNIAERIGRTTGQGLYRHCEFLGLPHPLPNMNNAGVMGQDSVQAVPYAGRIFWLWGDTNVPHYPLGNFRTTAAFTTADVEAENGIAFDYLTDQKAPSKLRAMLPLDSPGAVWLFGLLAVAGADGKETLLAHYGRHKSLAKPEDHGLAIFDDKLQRFSVIKRLDPEDEWRFPRGHAVREGQYFYFSDSFLHTRVAADWDDVIDPSKYEALRYDSSWKWQRKLPPTTQNDEAKLLLEGKMPTKDVRYQLRDAATKKTIRLHGSSITWNAYRQRWIMIGLQAAGKDDPSPLGEVWYAESPKPDGPWQTAVKVASHPRYSFYNPIHHTFLDKDGGRIIYFEGTYSLEFSGNPTAPAHFDYNQLMYRLDLDNEALAPVR